jgi:uncharacterized BrkB/YihY/UPF0761 family membrane protein
MNDAAPSEPLSTDLKALIRTRQYRVLLLLAALVGLLVSCASWLFLEAVHEIEVEVYENLPHDLGFVGACCVSVLRLPLASVMIATLLSARAGLEVAPLIVIAVVVAYLASEALSAYVDARIGRTPEPAATTPEPAPA